MGKLHKKIYLSDKIIFILLQWLTILILTFVLIFVSKDITVFFQKGYLLIFLFFFFNIALFFIPTKIFFQPLFDYSIFIINIIFISFCIYLTETFDLYLLYFLSIFIGAIRQNINGSVISALVAAITYGLVIFQFSLKEGINIVETSFLLRIPFFFILALLNGFLAFIARSYEETAKLIEKVKKEIKKDIKISDEDFKIKSEELVNVIKYFDRVLNNLTSGIIILNKTGKIIDINKKGQEILDLKEKEILNKHILDFPQTQIREIGKHLLNTLHTGITEKRIELTIQNQVGKEFVLGLTSSLIKTEDDKEIEGVSAIFADLTKIKEAEHSLKRVEKLALLGEMAATVSHEIKNPLHSIMGFAQLLKENIPPDDSRNKYLKIIIDEIQRINKVVLNILDFSRKTETNFQEGDINKLIEDVLLFSKEKLIDNKIELSLELNSTPKIIFDPYQLKGAFLNIIINAIQAMPKGGKLKISSRVFPQDKALEISITDTGPGISKTHLDKIFDPFFTTKEEGTGLGLSNTQQIIDLHHGKIEVKSEIGKGSTFIITLPYK